MEQRPLRLGDLVDDYCPRERRLTNHAIVAIVGDEIRQTRCNTCEADHVYKGGKVPVRKKKDTTAVLYDQVLANVTGGAAPADPPIEVAPVIATPPAEPAEPAADTAPAPAPDVPAVPVVEVVDETWTLHRTLIRASLPRNENHVPTPRPIPEFTMHQRNVRGSHMFRSGGHDRQPGNGGFGMNGDGPPRHHPRGDGQPGAGAPNGARPGSGRRRRRNKKPRPIN